MSFFEDLASALDQEGIESRVHDDVMFVPITSDVEIHFVEIDPHLPAANVYIAAADVDEDDESFESALVSVVFSVEDAVRTVANHIATDQVVTVLRDLLEGTDERIADLEFIQDPELANFVFADVTESAQVQVTIDVMDSVPIARVAFVAIDPTIDDAIDEVAEAVLDGREVELLSAEDREELFFQIASQIGDTGQEVLELGSFEDFDKLFDVLSLVADHAEEWEEQLVPLELEEDEYEVYDIFGADDEDVEDMEDTELDDFDDEEEDLK